MIVSRENRYGLTLLVGLALLTLLLVPAATFADERNSVLMPPHSVVAGKTLQEWSAIWWKRAYAIPANDNPLFDQNPTGDKSKYGDVGPVFFLGGVFVPAGSPAAATVYRTVTIPANKFIFFPVQNANNDNIGYGCNAPTTTPCAGRQTIDQLREAIAKVYSVLALHASVDGTPIPHLWDHLETSPAFNYTLQLTDSLVEEAFGYVGNDGLGTVFPAVADGYYLMLAPLSVGRHTINFESAVRVSVPGTTPTTVSMNITYYVTVTPGSSTQPAAIIS